MTQIYENFHSKGASTHKCIGVLRCIRDTVLLCVDWLFLSYEEPRDNSSQSPESNRRVTSRSCVGDCRYKFRQLFVMSDMA